MIFVHQRVDFYNRHRILKMIFVLIIDFFFNCISNLNDSVTNTILFKLKIPKAPL